MTSAPARVTWSTRLPSRARLETAVVLTGDDHGAPGGVTARIGISDDRRYEQLANFPLDAGATRAWQPVSVSSSGSP